MAAWRGLGRDVRGLSTVEYILILVIVAISAILLWQTFGGSVGSRVDQATQSVNAMESRGGGATPTGEGESAGSATAMAITEGRAGAEGGAGEGEGAGGMGSKSAMGGGSAMGVTAAGGASEGGAVAGARARRAGEAEGAAAGFDGSGGEAAELPDDGPDLFLWIGWLLVLILGGATLFSVLGKRIGKG